MQKVCLVILLLTFTIFLSAQKKSGNGPDYISIAYFGEKIFHPGMAMALYWQKRISVEERIPVHNLQYGLSLAGYVQPRNHLGFQLKPQAGYFIIMKKGFEFGLLAETGYMRRFYQGQVFEVKNRNVQQKKLSGQDAFLYGGYINLGYNPMLKSERKIRLFLQAGAFWEYPFNDEALIHPIIILGISKKISK